MCGLASTSTFTTWTTPSYFSASFSISGATMRQGPHQVAQKSTTTGLSFSRTRCWKVSSVACRISAIGAVGSFLAADRRSSPSAGDLLDESIGLEDPGVGEAIEDGIAVAARDDQAGVTEHREVLAHVRHLAADLEREVTDRALPVGQRLEDAQPLGIGQRSPDVGGPPPVGLGRGLDHRHEAILPL